MKPGNSCLALAIFLFCLAVFSSASAQTPAVHKPQPKRSSLTLEGHWSGSLQAGEAVLHLVLHVSKAEDGSLKATIDSLDQGVYGIEVTSLTQKDSTLHFNVASVGASYEGKFSADHGSIEGDWTQGSASLLLVFHRQAAAVGAKKPFGKARWKATACACACNYTSRMMITSSSLPRSIVPTRE